MLSACNLHFSHAITTGLFENMKLAMSTCTSLRPCSVRPSHFERPDGSIYCIATQFFSHSCFQGDTSSKVLQLKQEFQNENAYFNQKKNFKLF